jgi:hypothetical protein
MKESLSKITKKISPILLKLTNYKLFIFAMFLLLLFGFLVFRINTLNNQAPSDEEVSAKLERVSSSYLDQSIVDKIEQLQDNSVEVKSLFDEARNNPFSE